jgi:hypothetical protein
LTIEGASVATQPQPPSAPDQGKEGRLTQQLVALAGMPDDDPRIGSTLLAIAQLTADLVDPVSYASVTAHRQGAHATVAASSDMAVAVDAAQYADGAGPCLDALDGNQPVAVPDVSATMTWPGFRETAFRLGLRAALSVPLFAGRGTAIAALNLYGHDRAAMGVLTAAVHITYGTEPSSPDADPADGLGSGARALIAGLAGAFGVRSIIQQAIGVMIAHQHTGPDAAYATLRLRGAQTGLSLTQIAAAVIAEQQR